jgi:hypothetical protein
MKAYVSLIILLDDDYSEATKKMTVEQNSRIYESEACVFEDDEIETMIKTMQKMASDALNVAKEEAGFREQERLNHLGLI